MRPLYVVCFQTFPQNNGQIKHLPGYCHVFKLGLKKHCNFYALWSSVNNSQEMSSVSLLLLFCECWTRPPKTSLDVPLPPPTTRPSCPIPSPWFFGSTKHLPTLPPPPTKKNLDLIAPVLFSWEHLTTSYGSLSCCISAHVIGIRGRCGERRGIGANGEQARVDARNLKQT